MNPIHRTFAVVLLVALVWSGCQSTNDWTGGGGDDDGGIDSGGECPDEDGDGHGRGCAAGLDCDDSDPLHFNDCPHCVDGPAEGCSCAEGATAATCYSGPEGTLGIGVCRAGYRSCVDQAWTECLEEIPPGNGETCDGEDDDCDGEVDEGVDGECGDCDPSCVLDSLGSVGETPWDPREDNSEGVRVDEELGGLVLDSANVNTSLIWVANTAEGSVSKIDVRTYEELGRYATGTDPSRTSVNTLGDVYVGNRGGMSVTKISALGDRCPDTNGDGAVTTSSGSDVLSFGQDDCVLWRTELAGCGVIRAVAAQDEYGPDGSVHPYVWVGGYDGCVWKLDGETGEILINATASPTNTYGFALDGHGNLWIESGHSQLGRIDTNRCVDDTTCTAEVCGDDGDDCVKQVIEQPARGYGITVDFNQRVWIGGGSYPGGGGVARYDPSQPLGSRWTVVGIPMFVHGIAADAMGFVWGAGWDGGDSASSVWRIDADDPTQYVAVEGTSGYSAKGAAIDAEGKVWMINYSHNAATVITPGAGLHEATVETNVANVFNTPYTYSDMTGSQLRWATRPRGSYRTVFTGCEGDETLWGDLEFDLSVPDRTQVLFRARVADSPEALVEATWVVLATVPDDESPIAVGEQLEAHAQPQLQYLELELQLSSELSDGATRLTPVIYDMALAHRCPAVVQ